MKSYRYVDGEFSIENEIKRSRFIASVKGEVDGNGAEAFVRAIRAKYPDATHNCYAYISDINGNATRFSDDGEPSGTAGQPMLEVIRRQGLVRTAVVVTRYFGGIKLGAGGLVGAYSAAVADVLKNSVISQKTECAQVNIRADYTLFAAIESLIRKSTCSIDRVEYGDGVNVHVFVPLDNVDSFVGSVREASSGHAVVQIAQMTEFIRINKN